MTSTTTIEVKINKFLTVFLILLVVSYYVKGQTLLGIKGGLNFSTLIEKNTLQNTSKEVFKSYPSYCFEFSLKGRKPTPIHAGVSLTYSMNSFNYHYDSEGHFPTGENINYQLQCIRLTVFPEFSTGKRFQFFCNLSPYLNLMINSSKNGSKWSYEYIGNYYQLVNETIAGSANDDFNQLDIGFQESCGLGFQLNPWLGLTIEENGSLGCLNINKKETNWNLKNASLKLLLGVTFTFPNKKNN